MEQKNKKRLLRFGGTLLSGALVFALCSVFFNEQQNDGFNGRYSLTAFAETAGEGSAENQLNVTMSDIKYKISDDNQYMLLVTAFEADEVLADTANSYIIGYEIDSVDTFNDNGKKYYESIKLKTGETTSVNYTAKDVFGDTYTDYHLNVYEIENYDSTKDYTLRSFIKQITPVGDSDYTVDKVSYGSLATKHAMAHTEAKAATCTEDGNIEYWYCQNCDKYYSDASGATEITLADTVLTKTDHDKADTLSYDATGHWYPCLNDSTEQLDKADHVFDDGVDYSETQSTFTCACGYKKQDAYLTGTVSGTLACADNVDYTSFVITMYGEKYTYEFKNAVNESGEYTINTRIGENYKLVASSTEGYWGTVDPFAVAKENNEAKNITVEKGNVLGNVDVNGKTVKTYYDITASVIDDCKDGTVSLNWDYHGKPSPSFNGRYQYMTPVATQVKSGNFAYTATMSSTVFYGYAGIGITDGTSFLLMQTTNSPDYYDGGTQLQFGKFTETGWAIGYTNLIKDCGGVEKQASNDFLAKPAFVRVGDELKLYMGNVHVATLTKDGLTMPKNYTITTNFSVLTTNYANELANFMKADTEYGFLYVSTEIAGEMGYSSSFASPVSGQVTFPANVSANMQDTRLVAKNVNDGTYATYTGIFDDNGNYSLYLAAGEYEFLFSNPASLTKTVSVEVVENTVTSMGAVALESKNLATDSVIINNAEIKFGSNAGEYSDYVTMDITQTKEYVFNNTVYKGEAIFKGTFKAPNSYGTAGVGITDGSNAIRIVMSNGYENHIRFEYEQILPDKTDNYVSGNRGYDLSGSGLPCFNFGKTSLTNGGDAVDLNFYFHKKADGSIDVYYETLLLISVKSDGFYLMATGLTATTQDGKLYNDAAGDNNKPDASFVQANKEYAVYAVTVGGAGGDNAMAKASVSTVHVTEVDEKAVALKAKLSGKNLSVLGDSISTYHGVSNDNTTNSALVSSPAPYYPYNNVSTLDVPYWSKLTAATGMNLLVNNSVSGSTVTNCGNRAENLHADTGALAGTNPDVILVYLGINDVGATTITVEQFESAYREMIAKMTAKYPDADIFVIDLPYPDTETHSKEDVDAYNAVIHKIVAENSNLRLIQMNGSAADNAATLTCDGLHPNAAGMQAYYEVIRDALYNCYCALN